jgi:60 kDa SS-A/Ro ribonucleoprotein
MPMTALVRNLATMTRVGVIAPGSVATAKVVEQPGNADRIRKARIHPIALLAALRTYGAGRGVRGRSEC